METKSILSFLLAILCAGFIACSDDDDNTYTHTTTGTTTTSEDNTTISDTTLEANRFVYETMSDYYYWYTQMPNLDYRKQSDTEEYFDNLLYSGDKFFILVRNFFTSIFICNFVIVKKKFMASFKFFKTVAIF